MRIYKRSLVALFTLVTITACSVSRSLPIGRSEDFGQVRHFGASAVPDGSRLASVTNPAHLYVMTNRCGGFSQPPCISEYAPRQFSSPSRVILFKNEVPVGMAFDRQANLYVAVGSRSRAVAVFAPEHTNSRRSLTGSVGSVALAFNGAGDLYVLTASRTSQKAVGSLVIYAPGATKPNRIIKNIIQSPRALMFDTSGNLFVASPDKIAVIPPGKDTPSHFISEGVSRFSSMAVDPGGRLYVSNYGKVGVDGSVTIYSPKTWRLQQTLTNGIINPNAAAISPGGDLFVTNACASNYSSSSCTNFSVSIYKGQPLKLNRQITYGLTLPHYLAFGPSGYVYVSNCRNCSHGVINVYAPGGSTIVHQIGGRPNASGPSGIAFGPQ